MLPLWFEIAVVVLLLAIVVALGGIEVSILKFAARLHKAVEDQSQQGKSRATPVNEWDE